MGKSETDWVFWISIIRIKAWEWGAGFVLNMIDGIRISEVKKCSIMTERRRQREQ
jgi:hypothetical protein